MSFKPISNGEYVEICCPDFVSASLFATTSADAVAHQFSTEMKIETRDGVAIFKKKPHTNGPMFGCDVVMIIPPHPDTNCVCTSCALYRLQQDMEHKGYYFNKWTPK